MNELLTELRSQMGNGMHGNSRYWGPETPLSFSSGVKRPEKKKLSPKLVDAINVIRGKIKDQSDFVIDDVFDYVSSSESAKHQAILSALVKAGVLSKNQPYGPVKARYSFTMTD